MDNDFRRRFHICFARAPHRKSLIDASRSVCVAVELRAFIAYGDTCTGLTPTASGTPPVPAAAVYVSGGAAVVRLIP